MGRWPVPVRRRHEGVAYEVAGGGVVTTVEVLRAARARIAEPEDWTRCAAARDDLGEPTYPSSPQATCWCALGAAWAVSDIVDETYLLAYALPPEFRTRFGQTYTNPTPLVAVYNDHPLTTHADILALYDRAIAAAEAVAE